MEIAAVVFSPAYFIARPLGIKGKVKMSAVYFGGSRSFFSHSPVMQSVVKSVLASGQSVHVGCQFGVDALVSAYASGAGSSLVVFAVAPSLRFAPAHVANALACGARVVFSAGGQSAPMPARYLLRSVAAFQGCESAVFFNPGVGSLAVARECVHAGLPVYAFSSNPPAPIPSTAGAWGPAVFHGFACWLWFNAQQSLF